MKIIIKKRRKKICQPLAGPDPPLPPAIFSENRRISFFFRFTLHRQYSLCSLFHFVAFSYISVWPHKQGAAEYEEEAKSRITVHRATKVNSLDFGFPRVATNLVHLGGDQGPGWRPDWSTWWRPLCSTKSRWRPWLSGDQGATDVGVYTWRALSVKCLWTIGENMIMLVGTIMRTFL